MVCPRLLERRSEGQLCGQTGLLPTQRMQVQKLLALAAGGFWQCSEFPQTGLSITSKRVDSKPTLRCAVFELEGRGQSMNSLHVRRDLLFDLRLITAL
jgi:hypothetical protein